VSPWSDAEFTAAVDHCRSVAGMWGGTLPRTELYGLLARLCELVEHADVEALRTEFLARPRGARNRKYVESHTKVEIAVTRYVLDGFVEKNRVWRWGTCLVEARKRGLTSKTLCGWLVENGGFDTLFQSRPRDYTAVWRKTLVLTRAVHTPRSGVFTLRLMRLDDGRYEPVEDEA
jgi:hypothetical protein